MHIEIHQIKTKTVFIANLSYSYIFFFMAVRTTDVQNNRESDVLSADFMLIHSVVSSQANYNGP